MGNNHGENPLRRLATMAFLGYLTIKLLPTKPDVPSIDHPLKKTRPVSSSSGLPTFPVLLVLHSGP